MNEDQEIFAPIPAKSPELTGDMSCKEAAYRSLEFYFRNFLWNEKGTRLGKDPEFLHYLRVASKRLRVALNVFKKQFPECDISRYKNELKSLAPILGKARDTDVYLEFLNDKVSKTMSLQELEVFNEYKNFFLKRRRFRQKAVLNKLDSEDYKSFVAEFADFISRTSQENRNMESPVSEIVEQKIMRKVEKLIELSGKLSLKSSDSKLHKFRIKSRKLRYEVEISLSITGSDGEELDKRLIEFQRSLGSHHDAVTAGKKLNSFMRTHRKYSKSRVLIKIWKLQNERALKFRKKFIASLKNIETLRKFTHGAS